MPAPDPDFSRLGDARIFIDRTAYADQAAWHASAERLRKTDPLPLIDVEGFVPFRAVTRHADVAAVERNHGLFWNTRDSVLLPRAQVEQSRALGMDIKTLIHMDGAEHRATARAHERLVQAREPAPGDRPEAAGAGAPLRRPHARARRRVRLRARHRALLPAARHHEHPRRRPRPTSRACST
jgi:hypothetical protein